MATQPIRPGTQTEPSPDFVAGRAERVAGYMAEVVLPPPEPPARKPRKRRGENGDGSGEPSAWCHEKEQRIRELAALVAAGVDVRTATHVQRIDADVRRDQDGRPTAAGVGPAGGGPRPDGDGVSAGPPVGAVPVLSGDAVRHQPGGLPLGETGHGTGLPGRGPVPEPVPTAPVVTAARVRVVPPVPDRPWFTSGQVAGLLGVCRATAIGLIDSGAIAGYRVPGGIHRRVTRQSLLDYIAAKGLTVANTTQEPSVDTTPPLPPTPPAETVPAPGRWRLDTPAEDAVRAVTALTPEDLADCMVNLKLVPGKDRFAVYRTGGGETTPAVSVTLPDGSGPVVRLLVLRFLHELAAVAAGEKFAA